MKKCTYGLLIAHLTIGLPAYGMKRAFIEDQSTFQSEKMEISHLPQDIWPYILSPLSWYDLTALMLVQKAFIAVVKTSNLLDSKKLSLTDVLKYKEFISSFKTATNTLNFDRLWLAKSVLPTNSKQIKSYNVQDSAILRIISSTYSKSTTTTLKEKLSTLRQSLSKQTISREDPMHLETFDASKNPELLSLIWENMLATIENSKRKPFLASLKQLLIFEIIYDEPVHVANILATPLFASHLKTTKALLDLTYYKPLLHTALDYANPQITSRVMKWIYSAEQLSDNERHDLHLYAIVDCVLTSKHMHLDELLRIEINLSHGDRSAIFCIALLKGTNHVIQTLIDREVPTKDNVINAFNNGTLFSNEEAMGNVIGNIVDVYEYDSKILKPFNINICKEMVLHDKFQPSLCIWITKGINRGINDSPTLNIILAHIFDQSPSADNPLINAIFSSDLACFGKTFYWPENVIYVQNIYDDHGKPYFDLKNQVYILNRLLYWSLILGKYDYARVLLNGNWLLDYHIAAAVFDHYTKDLTTPETCKGKLVKVRHESANTSQDKNKYSEYETLCKALDQVPQHIKQRLMICCLFNESFHSYERRNWSPPLILRAPISTHTFLNTLLYELAPSPTIIENIDPDSLEFSGTPFLKKMIEEYLSKVRDYLKKQKNESELFDDLQCKFTLPKDA